MKFLYLILALVPAALANDLIKCPCSQQDCSKAQDTCACENTNLVNQYFCCDGGTDAAKNLGLKDCKTGKRSISDTDTWSPNVIPCGGPDNLDCPSNRPLCINIDTGDWGICTTPDPNEDPWSSPWTFEVPGEPATTTTPPAATPTVFVTSTIIVFSTDSDSTPSVPISTSTAIETTTVIPEPASTSTAIETTTVAPEPISTSTTIEIVSVPAPTLVDGIEITTLITSTTTLDPPDGHAYTCVPTTTCDANFVCHIDDSCDPVETASWTYT